jgi:hypothetical protein
MLPQAEAALHIGAEAGRVGAGAEEGGPAARSGGFEPHPLLGQTDERWAARVRIWEEASAAGSEAGTCFARWRPMLTLCYSQEMLFQTHYERRIPFSNHSA